MVSLVTEQLTIAHHTISLSPSDPKIDSTCSANRWPCCQGDVHLESTNVSMEKNSSIIFISDVILQQESARAATSQGLHFFGLTKFHDISMIFPGFK